MGHRLLRKCNIALFALCRNILQPVSAILFEFDRYLRVKVAFLLFFLQHMLCNLDLAAKTAQAHGCSDY